MRLPHIGLIVTLLASPLAAQTIGLSFAGDNGGGTANQISASDPAGVVAASNWNLANTVSGSLNQLTDGSGSATGVSVSWSANNTWGGIPGTPGSTTSDEFMVNGWLDDGGGGATINFSDIPFATYDVYVYGSSDVGNNGRGLTTNVNGQDYFSGGVFESLTAGSYFSSSAGFVNAATTANDPTYFRISGLSNPTLSVTGQRNTNGPVLPGGSTDYRGGISGIQIVPNADATATLMINRDTGEISLNGMGGTYEFAGYTMTSELGTLSEDAWVSIAGNYDSMGDGSVSSDAWNIFSATSQELSEGTLGQGAVDATVPISLGEGTWRKYFDEDVQMQVLDLNGNVNVLQVTYTGNGGQPFAFGDLNFDGAIDALDWPTVRDNFNAALSDLSSVDNYYAGDLTEDGQVDLDDLLAFETLYDAENGAGSFARLVPEPSSWTLLLFGSLAFWRRKPNRRPL